MNHKFQIAPEFDAIGSLSERMRQVMAKAELACDLDNIEIVVAEALNNVIEHGCLKEDMGKVSVSLYLEKDECRILIADYGKAYQLPTPKGFEDFKDYQSFDDLPEGGYGWSLIHELTRSVDLTRQEGQNCLTLVF